MEQSDVKQVTRDRKSEKLVRTPEEHVTFETVQWRLHTWTGRWMKMTSAS
jgi:hypothetical protein